MTGGKWELQWFQLSARNRARGGGMMHDACGERIEPLGPTRGSGVRAEQRRYYHYHMRGLGREHTHGLCAWPCLTRRAKPCSVGCSSKSLAVVAVGAREAGWGRRYVRKW
jgi:hypothetical protein